MDPSDELWLRVMNGASAVELICDEYFVPDHSFPADYTGPRFVATCFGERLATLDHGDVHVGIDTAVGRTMTVLRLRLDEVRTGGVLAAHAQINHYAPRELPPPWAHVVRAVHAASGPLPPPLAEVWRLALRWTLPQA